MTDILSQSLAPRRRRALRLSDYLSLSRQRRALARLDAEQLEDLGLNAEEAQAEAERPIWDVPTHWMH